MSDKNPELIAESVRPLRPPKARPVASGWDWSEAPPSPDAEVQAKLRALDEHTRRAAFTARFCYVGGA